jgi:hypothetical protein
MKIQNSKSTDKKRVLAVMTHHCALKIRKRYYFEDSILKEDLQKFPNMKLEINEFSKFVKSARDNFTLISSNPNIVISGVIEDKVFDVFFGSVKYDDRESTLKLVEEFEEQLLKLNFGDDIYQQTNTNYQKIS